MQPVSWNIFNFGFKQTQLCWYQNKGNPLQSVSHSPGRGRKKRKMEIVSSVFKDFAKFCDALLNMVFLKAEICQWGGMHGVSRQKNAQAGIRNAMSSDLGGVDIVVVNRGLVHTSGGQEFWDCIGPLPMLGRAFLDCTGLHLSWRHILRPL